MTTQKLMKKGFTLIEIVIVLAIAALIMVVVFFAVTGAQRSQRDQARKDYANAGLAKVTEFRGNNNGTSATLDATIFGQYMGGRTVNNTTPTITVGAPAANAACTSGGAAGAVVQVQGAALSTGEQVAICLESDVWYVARNQ